MVRRDGEMHGFVHTLEDAQGETGRDGSGHEPRHLIHDIPRSRAGTGEQPGDRRGDSLPKQEQSGGNFQDHRQGQFGLHHSGRVLRRMRPSVEAYAGPDSSGAAPRHMQVHGHQQRRAGGSQRVSRDLPIGRHSPRSLRRTGRP